MFILFLQRFVLFFKLANHSLISFQLKICLISRSLMLLWLYLWQVSLFTKIMRRKLNFFYSCIQDFYGSFICLYLFSTNLLFVGHLQDFLFLLFNDFFQFINLNYLSERGWHCLFSCFLISSIIFFLLSFTDEKRFKSIFCLESQFETFFILCL